MDLPDLLEHQELLQKIGGSLAWILGVLLVRSVCMRFLRHQKWYTDEMRMRWHLRLGQLTLILLGFGIILLWGSEIRTMALSAVAIAAAIVIALKELILCVSGSIYRAASDAFSVGDRVELGNVRGDVISYGMLTTTVLEIGPNHLRTGRAVVIPNSLLLSTPLVNETITDDYVLHSFSVHLEQSDDWKQAEHLLLEAANVACEPYRDSARRHMNRVTSKYGLPPATVEPRVSVMLPAPGQLDLVVRIPTPAQKKGGVEQAILREYLERRQVPPPAAE